MLILGSANSTHCEPAAAAFEAPDGPIAREEVEVVDVVQVVGADHVRPIVAV